MGEKDSKRRRRGGCKAKSRSQTWKLNVVFCIVRVDFVLERERNKKNNVVMHSITKLLGHKC